MFDTLTIAVLTLFAVSGLMRGWLTVLGQMICWFLSLLIAIMTSSYLTDYFINGVNMNDWLGAGYAGVIEIATTIFVFGLSMVITAGFVRGSALHHSENANIELGDKIVGLFFGAIQGAAVMVLVYALAFALVGKKENNFLQKSTSGQYLDPITRQIIKNITPEISGKERYKSLINIFGTTTPNKSTAPTNKKDDKQPQ